MRERLQLKNDHFLQIFYAVLVGVLLLDYLLLQAYDSESTRCTAVLAFVRLTAAALGVGIGKLWKDKFILFLTGFLVYLGIRVAILDGNLFFSDTVSESIFNAIWLIGSCYSLGKIFTLKQLTKYMRIFVALWTIGIAIHCLIALIAAWTDHEVLNLSGGSVWGIPYSRWAKWIPERLHIGYVYPTTAGSTISISGIIALCAILAEPKRGTKCLYALAYIIIVITLGLLDARTAFISLSAGAGIAVGTVIWEVTRNRRKRVEEQKTLGRQKALSYLSALMCAALVFAVSMICLLRIAPVFNEFKSRGSVVFSTAEAEGEESEDYRRIVQSRGISGEELLNGRMNIWKNVLCYMGQSPERWLFGLSIYDPIVEVNRQFDMQAGHSHNMILQVFLESGVPGLLFMFVMITRTVICSIRLIKNQKAPLWLRLVPAVIAVIITGDMAECFGWFRQWMLPAPAILFICFGLVFLYGGKDRQDSTACLEYTSEE